jgi:hypothetical protein
MNNKLPVIDSYVWRQFKDAEKAIDDSPDPLGKGSAISDSFGVIAHVPVTLSAAKRA